VELNNPELQNQQINTNTLIWAPRRRTIGIINAEGGHQNRFQTFIAKGRVRIDLPISGSGVTIIGSSLS
jgi:hypothetical protein